MTNSNSRKMPDIRELINRRPTRIFETYSPRKLPDGATKPEGLQFKGHQRPGDPSSNQSESSNAASTPEQSGKPEVSEPDSTPTEPSQS